MWIETEKRKSEKGQNMRTKPTPDQIDSMVREIREYLIDESLWLDVTIYANGKAYTSALVPDHTENGMDVRDNSQKQTTLVRNDYAVLDNVNPADYFEYVNPDHILSMSFEGSLYSCLNLYGEHTYQYEIGVCQKLEEIFKKYGCYSTLGNCWNLTLFLLPENS